MTDGLLSGRASGSATETITQGLAVTVTADAASYVRGGTVSMTVLVQQGTLAVASARVTLTLTKSDGSSQKWRREMATA